MNAADVLLAIEQGKLDEDIELIASRARERSLSVKRKELKIGSTVSFDAKGTHYRGVVVKINPKTVAVDTFNGPKYRVHPSLLTVEG